MEWTNPPGVAETPDPRFTSARPVGDPESYSKIGIAWVDADGTVLADDFLRDRSPAELALEHRYEQPRDVDVLTRTVVGALELPETRDHHTALQWLAGTEGIDPGLIRARVVGRRAARNCQPPNCLSLPRWTDREGSLDGAGYPVWRLVELYMNEGFLADALRAEAMLDALPEEARSDYRVARATRAIEALEELRG